MSQYKLKVQYPCRLINQIKRCEVRGGEEGLRGRGVYDHLLDLIGSAVPAGAKVAVSAQKMGVSGLINEGLLFSFIFLFLFFSVFSSTLETHETSHAT